MSIRDFFKRVLLNPITFFIVATVIFTWPMVTVTTTHLTNHGDPFFVTWVMRSTIDKIKSGNLSEFWQSNTFYPYPDSIAFSDHSLTLTLQALPVSFINDSQIFLANYTQLVAFFLSGLFSYLLIFHYTKNRWASLIGGLVYAFSPYHIGKINHLQIMSYQYLPLTVLFFEKLLTEGRLRNGFYFAVAFLLNALISIYLFVYSLIPLTIILIVRAFAKQIKITKRSVAAALIGAVIVLAVAIPMFMPYLRVSENLNIIRNIDDVEQDSARVGDFLISPENHIYMHEYVTDFRAKAVGFNAEERSLFFGFFTLFIASITFINVKSLFTERRFRFDLSATKLIFVLTALSALVLAFGVKMQLFGHSFNAPGYYLYENLVFFKALRAPGRFGLLILFGLSTLVGLSLAQLSLLGKRQLIMLAVSLLLVVEQITLPVRATMVPPIDESLGLWTKQNLPAESRVVHHPFYYGLTDYLRIYDTDPRTMFNGYSGVFPKGTRSMMDATSLPEFAENPKMLLQIFAALDVDYFILHKDYNLRSLGQDFYEELRGNIDAIPEVQLVTEINGDRVYDLTGLNDEKFLINAPEIELLQNEAEVTLRRTNSADTPWVNRDLLSYQLRFDYYLNGKKVGSQRKSLFQPLFVKPNQTIDTTLAIPSTFLLRYDKMEVIIESEQN